MTDACMSMLLSKVERFCSGEASPTEEDELIEELLESTLIMLEHIQYLQTLLTGASEERSIQ
jgi:hypothetical protein